MLRGMRPLAATIVAAAVLVPAAGGVRADPAARPAAADSGVVRLGIISSDLWVDNPLDPGVSFPGELLNELYSGLVKLDDNYRVRPDLAQAMPTISADHLTYTFTLRPNLE